MSTQSTAFRSSAESLRIAVFDADMDVHARRCEGTTKCQAAASSSIKM